MAELSNTLEISDKMNFEVILLDMVEFNLQSMIFHTKIRLRYVTNSL